MLFHGLCLFLLFIGSEETCLKAAIGHFALWSCSFLAPCFLALRPFGCYRVWQAIVRWHPSCFYASIQEEVPQQFRLGVNEECEPMEPDCERLGIKRAGIVLDLAFGILYMSCVLLPLLLRRC